MSSVKKSLLARKKELEAQLKPFFKIQEELDDVIRALKAFEEPRCESYCSGCDICRRGPEYR